MSDLDPGQAGSFDDLAGCLRQLHLRADSPSYRLLEDRTKHANGLLPGTKIQRVPLRRSTLSEVLRGETFPRKGFMLTFVEACGVDLQADRRWEQAWDRLADQAPARKATLELMQRQLQELRQQLADAEERAEAARLHAQAQETSAKDMQRQLEVLHGKLAEAEQRAQAVAAPAESREHLTEVTPPPAITPPLTRFQKVAMTLRDPGENAGDQAIASPVTRPAEQPKEDRRTRRARRKNAGDPPLEVFDLDDYYDLLRMRKDR